MDCPLERALICAAAAVESNTSPKQAPPMTIATAKLLEGVATSKELSPAKRDFSAGVLLMSCDIVRFSEDQMAQITRCKFGLNSRRNPSVQNQ